jgi:AAA15 family ATPase/GTPase
MIIEFRVTNFRSFKEPQTLSMVAETFAEHKETNTFDPGIKGFDERLVRSSAIYGANAAGKTNLLRALQYMQSLVLTSANPMAGVQYNPFKFSSSTRNAPSEFELTFIQNSVRYEYGFAIGATQIEKEWLIEFVHPRGRTNF